MKNDFSNVEYRDKVFSVLNGWGEVKRIDDRDVYCIRIDFENRQSIWIDVNGYTSKADVNPSVFWDEVVIVPPPKPKRKVEKIIEKWLNFYFTDDNRKTYSHSYETKEKADEMCDKKTRLGEACHVIHKYTVEE